jgi:hypothetical protein
MSLFRALNDACLEAKLTQNEARVYTTLINQTLGYGKSHDNLTDNRLAELTGLRLDRLRTAIDGVVDKGLFEVEPSRHYQYHYKIAESFLEKESTFFTPHLPKNRAPVSLAENNSELQSLLPNFSYKHNITLTSFNLTTLTQQHLPEPSLAEKKDVEQTQKPAEKKDVVEVVEVVEKINIEKTNHDHPAMVLPKIIEEKHHIACRKALNGLSPEQQQRVIKTLEIKDKTEVIYNPTGLLIALAKAEREGRLILPTEKKQPPAYTPAHTASRYPSHHPSHLDFDSPQHSSNRVTEGLEDHIGKLDWLKTQAEDQGQSLPEFAKMMMMNVYLEDQDVVRRWLALHAQKEQIEIDVLAYRLGLNIKSYPK